MYDANKNELETLEFWKKNQTFEKSVNERPANNPYVFYDGPPFATGLPHYGHIMAGTKKDVVPRYQTMKGKRVERVWGWDCHGLPIENLIEKELGLSGPKEIRDYGVDKFNEACRAKVMQYAKEWQEIIPRMGRWVNMEQPYKTMDPSFMESVWWVFSQLHKKGLVYEGHKAMQICPHCGTPLSNFEVAQGYKDVKDISVFVKFKATNAKEKLGLDGDVYILAWTTTPWTLPGNILLAVGGDIRYTIVSHEGALYVVAKERLDKVFKDKPYEVVKELSGFDLVGLVYEPVFPYYADTANAFRVVAAEFVSTEDGSGIVHIAPAFGEDDYAVGKREGIPLVQHVSLDGKMKPEVTHFAGMDVKPKGEDKVRLGTDIAVLKYLQESGAFFAKENITHSYPHCWRCDTPLLNYATSSWFVKVTEIKEQLIANNGAITWIPEHIKEGRFGKWLEGVKDWSISRNRFWGTPLPVWRCTGEKKCVDVVIASASQLEKVSGQNVPDLHKHLIDPVTFPCPTCGSEMQRVPEVLDTWFDSGCVPYGQMHYPFENKEKFEKEFPADYIAESQDQTRGWFYTLHVIATALTSGTAPSIGTGKSTSAFKTVSVNGIILAEDGQKMSKRLQNYPDPMDVVNKYGADALRYYLLSSPVMHGESLNFSEAGVREVFSKVVNTLWNVVEFYQLFAGEAEGGRQKTEGHVLDTWILAKLHLLNKEVSENMDNNRIAEAVRPIVEFITELSQWYVRRSRDRFKGEDEADKQAAIDTLHEVLLTLTKIMAPFTPFLAEKVYQTIGGEKESVHLEDWPETGESVIDTSVLEKMATARKIVEMGLALRAEAGVKVRQVLGEFTQNDESIDNELRQIIADEMNVKQVTVNADTSSGKWLTKEDATIKVALHIEITDELKKEGLVREIVRAINLIRKEQNFTIQDEVIVSYNSEDTTLMEVFETYGDEVKRQVMAKELRSGGDKEIEIDGKKLMISIEKA